MSSGTNQPLAFGIDVGGTSTRVGLVDGGGAVLSLRRRNTNVFDSPAAFGASIAEDVNLACAAARASTARVSSIGLALPGLIDPRTGTLIRSVNLSWLEGSRLGESVATALGRRVVTLTDADAATWGEYRSRPGPAPDRFMHFRFGTGIALGYVSAKLLTPIEPDRRGHLDLLIADRSKRALFCRCGKRGCLDTIASGPALIEAAKVAGIGGGLAGLQTTWEKGDAAARNIVEKAALASSAVLSRIICELNLSVVNIGGGVLEHLPALASDLRFSTADLAAASGPVLLEPSMRGDNAGVVGAALWAFGKTM